MKTSTLPIVAALAALAFSTASHAAWYAKIDGAKGAQERAGFFKTADGLKSEYEKPHGPPIHSKKPKEIVVVSSKLQQPGKNLPKSTKRP